MFLSRLLGTPLPERVTGVDLTGELLRRCECTGQSAFFFGGSPLALASTLERIRADHPGLAIAGAVSPTVDLDGPTGDEAEALAAMRAAAPDLVFIFLGSPKGEKWFLRRRAELPPSVFVSVGATVNFLAGDVRRAPTWVQSAGLEWLWRLAHEPRRLFRRYVIRDSRFAVIAARELLRAPWALRRLNPPPRTVPPRRRQGTAGALAANRLPGPPMVKGPLLVMRRRDGRILATSPLAASTIDVAIVGSVNSTVASLLPVESTT